MSSSIRSGSSSRTSVRPGVRSSTIRHASRLGLDRGGAVSPAESLASTVNAGMKRKERDFDTESVMGGEETNINVVVRCRGRSQREVKENSTVVVKANGVKGTQVDLSMGPNALSNKTYTFDRVYSPAADQSMIFDDTVKPILDEVSLRAGIGAACRHQLTETVDAFRIQLHNIRVRSNRNWKNLHNVWRYDRDYGSTI